MRISITIAAAALTFAVVGCTSNTAGHGAPSPTAQVFDAKAMARDIEQQSQRVGTPLKNVICPANEAVRAGNQFDCLAGNVKIHIEVTSNLGDYRWNPEPAGQ